MDDPKLRLRCVKLLQQAGFKLGKAAFNKEAKYSRFYSETAKVEDLTDFTAVSNVAQRFLSKAKKKIPIATEVLRNVFNGN